MKKLLVLLIVFITFVTFAQPKFTPISTMPGAFSRMGFGARGMGMGNALSAVIDGNLVSYYNPAVIVYQQDNSFQTSYSILSLDRHLNFLNFTRKFDFYARGASKERGAKPQSTAGVSVGIINSGVSKIDGRDNSGNKTGDLSTSENQFFLAFANKFSSKFSLGVSVKFYYYKLYESVTSTGVGLDVGALYRINNQWNVSLMLSDLNSKYKWDTSPIYSTDGTTSENKFPILKKLGLSYTNRDLGIIADAEFENSNAGTNYLRAGVEYNIFDKLYLRTGFDQFNLSNSDDPAQPTFGFSYFRKFGNIVFGVDYAFIIEHYSPSDRHIIGISANF